MEKNSDYAQNSYEKILEKILMKKILKKKVLWRKLIFFSTCIKNDKEILSKIQWKTPKKPPLRISKSFWGKKR